MSTEERYVLTLCSQLGGDFSVSWAWPYDTYQLALAGARRWFREYLNEYHYLLLEDTGVDFDNVTEAEIQDFMHEWQQDEGGYPAMPFPMIFTISERDKP